MTDTEQQITSLLALFRLPTASQEMVSRVRQAGHDLVLPVIAEVLKAEADDRHSRRVDRLRKQSKLLPGKTLDGLEPGAWPLTLHRQLRDLCTGVFLDNATNVLAFGLPGTGKTHAACAIGEALVREGRSVLFAPAYRLVQDLLAAKRDLSLPSALRKLDAFELLILDDIGYVKQRPDEVEVLFTLLAERYERRSLLITSNLVFSAWDQIFQNPMTTAAAIDRLVHHSVILEFDVASYRKPKTSSKQ